MTRGSRRRSFRIRSFTITAARAPGIRGLMRMAGSMSISRRCLTRCGGTRALPGGFDLAARRTVQQFEMDDDLGDSTTNFGYGGKAVADGFRLAGAIWPAAASEVNVMVYANGPEDVSVEIVGPGGGVLAAVSGAVPLALNAPVGVEGRYVLQAKLSTAGAASGQALCEGGLSGACGVGLVLGGLEWFGGWEE